MLDEEKIISMIPATTAVEEVVDLLKAQEAATAKEILERVRVLFIEPAVTEYCQYCINPYACTTEYCPEWQQILKDYGVERD